jgi:class 3 adenylate cyclase
VTLSSQEFFIFHLSEKNSILLRDVSILFGSIYFLLYQKYLFPHEYPHKPTRILFIGIWFILILVLLGGLSDLHGFFSKNTPILGVFTGIIMIQVFRSVYHDRKGSKLSMFGVLLLLISYILPQESGYEGLFALGIFLYVISQSILISRLQNLAFRKIETLSEDLKRTSDSYSRFVPMQFLNFLNRKSILDVRLGDQIDKEMTILFSDIRSFTAISEKMSPKENFLFINSYLKRMNPIVERHNGLIDKYIGDSILALFPNHPSDAIKTAIEMQERLRIYNHDRLKSGFDPIRVGIGIHSGRMMLGTIGSPQRMESTVISDSVNLASRIEGLTKVYGASILVTAATLYQVEFLKRLHYRFLDKVRVRGKHKAVTVYELFDGQSPYIIELFKSTKDIFEQGVTAYIQGDMKQANENFEEVLRLNPSDEAAKIYLRRTQYYFNFGVSPSYEAIEYSDK